MNIGSMFTGYGGLDMAVEQVTGATPAWFVEHDPAPSKVLAHRWPTVPNHHDVTAADWANVEPVDILTGGFPCQDLSHAGKRLGLRPGTSSGLWEHMAYAIDQLRPRLVVIENVRGLLSANAHSDLEPCPWCVGGAADGEPALRALGAVLGDLADLGYDAQWSSVRASDVGAPHGRFRVFIVAHPANADVAGLERRPTLRQGANEQPPRAHSVEPDGVVLLPTPTAGDSKASRNSTATRHVLPPTGIHAGDTLTDITEPPRRAADFGPYAPAIARWEAVLGRPAPSPTEPGKDDRPRLSPAFVEWMMGLPAGHVTDPAIGLSRAQQLKALGNGVVPAQAAAALQSMRPGYLWPWPRRRSSTTTAPVRQPLG